MSVSLSNFQEIPLTQFVHIHNYQTGFRFRQQNNSNVCLKITISIFKINRFTPDFWCLSSVSLKILSYFHKPKNIAILGNLWQFWDKKEQKQLNFSGFCSNWQRYENLSCNMQARTSAFAGFACSANRILRILHFFQERETDTLIGVCFSLAEV